jgi:hypothetical protein
LIFKIFPFLAAGNKECRCTVIVTNHCKTVIATYSILSHNISSFIIGFQFYQDQVVHSIWINTVNIHQSMDNVQQNCSVMNNEWHKPLNLESVLDVQPHLLAVAVVVVAVVVVVVVVVVVAVVVVVVVVVVAAVAAAAVGVETALDLAPFVAALEPVSHYGQT